MCPLETVPRGQALPGDRLGTYCVQASSGWMWTWYLIQSSMWHRLVQASECQSTRSVRACLRRAVKLMNGCHISNALADLGSYWQAHCSQYVSQLITSNFIFLSVLFDKLSVIFLFCNSEHCPSPGDAWKFFSLSLLLHIQREMKCLGKRLRERRCGWGGLKAQPEPSLIYLDAKHTGYLASGWPRPGTLSSMWMPWETQKGWHGAIKQLPRVPFVKAIWAVLHSIYPF